MALDMAAINSLGHDGPAVPLSTKDSERRNMNFPSLNLPEEQKGASEALSSRTPRGEANVVHLPTLHESFYDNMDDLMNCGYLCTTQNASHDSAHEAE